MNRKSAVRIFLIAVVAATLLYVVFVPPRGGYLGRVGLSVRQYQTNALGLVTAMVAITNGGPHTIRLTFGTKVQQKSGWLDPVTGRSNHLNLIPVPDPLMPAAGKVVEIDIPVTTLPWRVSAMCQKDIPGHWSGKLLWNMDALILNRGVVEYFYSTEIQK